MTRIQKRISLKVFTEINEISKQSKNYQGTYMLSQNLSL